MGKVETTLELGLKLKIERIRKRVKQTALAEKTGIKQSRLSYIETGRAAPRQEELALIKRALQELAA